MSCQPFAHIKALGDFENRGAFLYIGDKHGGSEIIGAAFLLRVQRAFGREVMLEPLASLKPVRRVE